MSEYLDQASKRRRRNRTLDGVACTLVLAIPLVSSCSASPPKSDRDDTSLSAPQGPKLNSSDDGLDLELDGVGESPDNRTPPGQAVSRPELWYSSGDLLVYLEMSAADGSLLKAVGIPFQGLPKGQNSITMLAGGALLGARVGEGLTTLYAVENPPREPVTLTPRVLGIMPDGIKIEGLYTDCAGRLYAMDTGRNVQSAEGNRLLRFIGNPLQADFAYEVVTDLARASVADMDDLGPGIAADGSTITDNPGIAIDTGTLYHFDYTTGTGSEVGHGGTFGVHALGGALFSDSVARVYVLEASAQLRLYNPVTEKTSPPIGQGPQPTPGTSNARADSALTGPLTDCVSEFPPIVR